MKKKDGELDYNQQNSRTLEALFGNVYYKKNNPKDKKASVHEYTDNIGKCKAVHMYGTVMSGKFLPDVSPSITAGC
jgi:hypothetical protein